MDLDLHFGAAVVSSDGRTIGTVERAIVEAEGLDPHSIVVRESREFTGRWLAAGSLYFSDEIIVPIGAVASATEERVSLSLTSSEVRRLRPYLSYRYRALDAKRTREMLVALATPGNVLPPDVDEVAGKASDEIEIDDGENVMLGHTGRKLGHVRDVLLEDGELVGVVMHPEGFFKEDVVIPVRFLARSDDLALFLDATEEDLEHLAPAGR